MTKTNLEVIQLSNIENHLNRGGFFLSFDLKIIHGETRDLWRTSHY